MRTSWQSVVSTLVLLGPIGCEDPGPPVTWPDQAWQQTSPEAQGISSWALADLLEEARAEDLALHSLFVARNGYAVLDVSMYPYDGTQPHDIASCTKSLTSFAVGVAIDRQRIDGVDEHLVEFLPRTDKDDPRRERITIEHALTMTTGFECISEPVELTLQQMQDAENYVEFALGRPMVAEPGTVYGYCSPASHLLSAVVGEAAGQPTDEWLRTEVFSPIGVGPVEWPRDPQGVAHGWGDARMLPADLARVGLLMMRGGRWRDQAIVDPMWVDESTREHVAPSADEAYGYQWWVSGNGGFSARGRGGQFLFVLPALDLVVVTTGAAGPQQVEAYAELLRGSLLPAVQSDAPLPEDPTGRDHLAEVVDAARRPPGPTPVPPAPDMAAEIDGRTYAVVDDNPLGWQELTWTIEDDAIRLRVSTLEHESDVAIGLDGVPRVNRNVTFAELPRHVNRNVALAGTWQGPRTLLVRFDSIESIDAGTLTFVFDDDGSGLEISLFERTFLGMEITFRAEAG